MIPEHTIKALTDGVVGHLGTVGADLKTIHTDILSASCDKENDTVTCFARKILAGPTLEKMKETGRVSYFFGLMSHEAYQFKGSFIETCELTEAELEQSSKFRDGLQEVMEGMGIERDKSFKMLGTAPDIGIKFKVEKIFIQTPGPDAGKELQFK